VDATPRLPPVAQIKLLTPCRFARKKNKVIWIASYEIKPELHHKTARVKFEGASTIFSRRVFAQRQRCAE
jgi:hypothetical protein